MKRRTQYYLWLLLLTFSFGVMGTALFFMHDHPWLLGVEFVGVVLSLIAQEFLYTFAPND